MKDFLALMNPTRWLVLVGLALALVGTVSAGLWRVHMAGMDAGRAECAQSRQTAQGKQDTQVAGADIKHEANKAEIKLIYKTRIEKVTEYVPTRGTSCPADPGFLRDFNAAQ